MNDILKIKLDRHLIGAFLIPTSLILFVLLLGWALPGFEPSNGVAFIYDNVEQDVIEQSGYIIELLNSNYIFVVYPLLILVTAILGPIFNFPIIFGEEYGWRGFLRMTLKELTVLERSYVTGIVWGAWHFPLIMTGYNYGEFVYIGLIFMVIITLLLSPLLDFYASKGDNNITLPIIIHGGLNSLAAFPVLLTNKFNPLLIGFTGVFSILFLLIFDLVLLKKVWNFSNSS